MAMKYIDAELLRKEIEKNKNMIDALFTEGDDSVYDGENDAYNRVLRIIDSLQQEPDKNLEEAAEKYRRASCNAAMKPNIDGPIPEYGGNVKAAFIAGAQWMENQFKHCGSFPVEDQRGGYWPTDYYIKK